MYTLSAVLETLILRDLGMDRGETLVARQVLEGIVRLAL